ncbi:hypothetical protein [Marinoscillum sp. MHG1-6]|uniref:hypothetical protein n=1 Tax=Marinoscillum sp. MHG1-6 TaxID=2959627 RepID=UPI0021579731|nr:hypothetical protein [Marinoscillum sp. MHG1-6]
MLEYFKTVLSKVSFDDILFEKELLKAISSLNDEEVSTLEDWCFENYEDRYGPVLIKCFASQAA